MDVIFFELFFLVLLFFVGLFVVGVNVDAEVVMFILLMSFIFVHNY